MTECGASAAQAASLAANMVEWRSSAQGQSAIPRARYLAVGLPYRPPQGPFQAVGEIGLVQGMTPDLLHALIPHLSVTQPNDPDITQADATVRQALRRTGDAMPPPPTHDETRPNSFVADITIQDGQVGRTTRQAVVLLTPAAGPNASLEETVHIVQLTSGL